MQKRQSDVRRPPVPIFAAKRPRTALLAHPNNTKTDNETCPTTYTGSSHAKPTNPQWSDEPNNTWQNPQQGSYASGQQHHNPPNQQAPSWQQQPNQRDSTWQQELNLGNSTWQQQPNEGNSTWQQQPNQGNSTWQQQPKQGNSTWQQQPNQGSSTWQQQPNQGSSTLQQQPKQGNSTWQQQPNQGSSTWQQQPKQGNSTWQQQPKQGNSTWQQKPDQGSSTLQQKPNQGNSTLQQKPNQGNSTWQQQQPHQQVNQGPGNATRGKSPQMKPNPTPEAQGNQPQPKYGQSVPNVGNDCQIPQSYGNQNRQGGYQGRMQPQPQPIQHQQQAGQYNGNRANGQALKQTTIHQSFKHTITQRQPQDFPNQPIASYQGGQGSHSSYGVNKPQVQMHGNDTSPSPRYGETPSKRSYGQQKSSTASHQPWGMANVPNQAPFTPSDNLPSAANNQGIDTPQATTSDVTKSRAPDKSLKLLSATVQGMQHWSRYREKTALIFELIGRVDSAVRNDQQSSFREFMLKDDKDQAVRCVFFEIDRPFPNVVRGQFYRCVGTYEPGNKRVRCVSVRLATETERRLHRACVAASDRTMRDWTSSIRES